MLVNYYPKLGDFTDEWNMVNDEGEGLHIGVLHFNNTRHPLSAPIDVLKYCFKHASTIQ